MKHNNRSTLRLPALEIRQGPRRTLYTFAVDGKELANFATISRIGRTEEHTIKGYQRPEVLSHIADIQQYLESSNPMIPNAIVVAFNRSVRFEPSAKNGNRISYSRPGELVIPFRPDEPDENRPAWIVDGQQRMAAICAAKIKSFPICVVGFIASDDGEQREQFILVNSTKPLPKGLIREDIEPLKEICRWTDGYWDFGPGRIEVERNPEYAPACADAGQLPAGAVQGTSLESGGSEGEGIVRLTVADKPLPAKSSVTANSPHPDHGYMVPALSRDQRSVGARRGEPVALSRNGRGEFRGAAGNCLPLISRQGRPMAVRRCPMVAGRARREQRSALARLRIPQR